MVLASPARLAWRASRAATGLALDAGQVAAGLALGALGAAAGAAAGTAAGTARAGAEAARATTSAAGAGLQDSARIAGKAAIAGVRLTARVLTGADPAADEELTRVADATRAIFEPELARRTRRVWATHGRTHVELAAPAVEGGRPVRTALRRQLERLDGVQWATVNDVLGRVLVGFDQRRISVEEVVGVVTAIEQARGGTQVFPQRDEHPGDLEPLVAAAVTFLVDSAAVGVAFAGKLLPIPALTRHATAALALVDAEPRLKGALVDRFGNTGTGLVLNGLSAILHAATQSPTVPALNAAAAAQRVLEVSARRSVWQRREPELCRPTLEPSDEPIVPPGERPVPLPAGPIEAYRAKLGPASFGGALALLAARRQPGRSADLLKALTPKAAVHGRESFAATLDLLMCQRGVLPMDGSAYRRLDRIDAVVIDSGVLCDGRADQVDPLAEPLLGAVRAAGHRLVLTEHPVLAELTDVPDDLAPAGEPLADTVRRLQADGHGVLAVSATDSTGLMAADIGIAISQPQRPPAWGADLVTSPGLADTVRLVKATTPALRISQLTVGAALNGNIIGSVLATFGSPLSGQRAATKPGKAATALTMALGTVTAIGVNAVPLPAG